MPAPDQMHPAVFQKMSRHDDAQAAAQQRIEADRVAAEQGLWALADLYLPPDIREAAQRWKLDHSLTEIWRSAFIAGWRQAMRSAETRPTEGRR